MGEAVENHPSLRELCGGLAIVLLVEEIAGFLPLDVVDVVFYAVFRYQNVSALVRFIVAPIPAFVLRHAFLFADVHVVAFVYRVYIYTVFRQKLTQCGEYHVLDALDSAGEYLRHENVLEQIHHKSGE